jgi:hypothetical protein
MYLKRIQFLIFIFIISILMLALIPLGKIDSAQAQQPTGSIPTVTGTPKGPTAKIRIGLTDDRVRVRSGPSVLYPQIGVILLGAEVPVKGKSVGGDWLVVEYPGVPGGIGWIWALYMEVSPGELQIIENPPPPEPVTTITIDPTMAAQFVTTPMSTRLPTFTQPAPLVIPTYNVSTGQSLGGIPIGLVIIAIAGSGILIGLASYFQSR